MTGISVESAGAADSSPSSTIRVSSSTNSGTPSVISTICLTSFSGTDISPARVSIISSTWLGVKGFRESTVVHSGLRRVSSAALFKFAAGLVLSCCSAPYCPTARHVSTVKIRAFSRCAMNSVSNSVVEGSIQCKSSTTKSIGLRSATLRNTCTRTSNVCCRRCPGLLEVTSFPKFSSSKGTSKNSARRAKCGCSSS